MQRVYFGPAECVAVLIVVAPQSFKGCAEAQDVARAIAEGLRRVWPDARYELLPMADGGEGTVRTLVDATGGEYRTTTVRDPLGRRIEARWGLIDAGRTAVVEMAAASGLPLLRPGERDARRASSFGTGELLLAAARSGARTIVLGIGGSATNDGGAGMLRALGLRFLDREGRELGEGGAELERLERMEGDVDRALAGVEVVVASDVTNPLTGPEGASAVFGPQKGASAEDAAALDRALSRYADVVARRVGNDVRNMPGAGAAGGVGFALLAFLGATLRSGAELVLDTYRFDERARGASLCVTGEGRLDEQSLYGKVTVTVARRARALGAPTAAIVGSLGPGYEGAWAQGIGAIEPIATGASDIDTLLREWRSLVVSAAERLARAVQLGRALGSV